MPVRPQRPGLIRAGLIVLVAGLGQALSIATPWDGQPLWWLQLASLATLVGVLTRLAADGQPERWRDAAVLGWLFASAWLAGTWWWLYISLHIYGGLNAGLAVVAVLTLAAALALYYGLVCGLFYKLFLVKPSVKWSFGALFFAALWTVAELARARWFTGFPWGMGGYAHTDGPLAALAPWVGVYGIGGAAAWLAAVLAGLVAPLRAGQGGGKRMRMAFSLALVLAGAQLVGTAGPSFSLSAGTLNVSLLQGNIAQDQKFQRGTGVADALDWYGRALMDNRAALVVAPETAIPLLPAQLPDGYWAALQTRYSDGDQAALIGVPLGSSSQGYTNAVVGLRPGLPVPYSYDKHHLVPFGEFVPPFFHWFIDLMRIPLGDFNRGPLVAPSFVWQGQRLAPNICYEDLFGEELGARFADPARAPTMMVNVSNIAWFGDSLAIDQHLQISRMRALEFERPMLRATNTGATVIINHRGEVTHSLARSTRGMLSGVAEGRVGNTPYARWVSIAGLWPLWGLGLLVVAGAALRVRRRR